jgi:hypothetical protein
MDELAPVIVEFNTKASTIFFSHYENFKKTVKGLDRKKMTMYFNCSKLNTCRHLRNELERLAQGLLGQYHTLRSANLLNKKLTDEINQYLSEFRQKSRSL